ncbi:MAG: TonB-dependent receptor [Flavobacteriales bacterium]|nr:TonB-dependent receptor [Flavobacteriales bacterium]
MYKKTLTLLFTFLFLATFAQEKFTISGYVKDAETGEELIGAQIFVKELSTGSVANLYGFYSITIPKGTYTVVYSFVGFASISETIELTQNITKDIELGVNSEVLKEFEVLGEAENNNIESIEMSVVKMEMETIKKIPALMGEVDILRAIKLLPGVQSGGEGSTGFFVRGGGLDQNLILIDGAPVYNASHLLGFFSVFNADAIKGAQLYKGGIPAEYGGRLSSVLDVRMKEGNQKRLSISGGIGMISSRLTIEAPIIKDKWSFIISGRRTYIDIFTRLSPREEIQNSRLWFYDLNGKTSFKINDKNRVFASYYSGRDAMGLNEAFGIDWGNKTFTLRWNHLFSEKLFSNVTYINSNFDYSIGVPTGDNAFEWNSKVKNNSLKNDYTYYANTKNTIKFGWESTFHKFTPAEFFPLSDESQFDTITIADKYAWENAIYVSNEMKIGKRWSTKYGLRYSIFSNSTQFYNENKTNVYFRNGKLEYNPNASYNPNDTVFVYGENYEVVDTNAYEGAFNLYNNYHGPEPRLSVKYKLNEHSSIKASYNRMRQYLHLATNTSGGTPIDIWISSSPNIKPQLADQIALGYFKNFKKNMFETSVEIYYKKMYNQLDWKDHASLIFILA